MPQFLKFLTYNNAVPIAVSLMLLGAGGAFAATDPAAIYSSQQQVISIDNTYLVNKDLSTYQPKVEITGVTEDSDNYYVAYKLYTIDLENYVWRDIARGEIMQVSKADLGPYRDLGTYVTEKLKDVVGREYDRLLATQTDARAHVSQKVVATQYGGLIGKFLDPTTEQLPGYTPVVQAPPPPSPQVAAAADGSSSPSTPAQTPSTSSAKIGLQLLGNDPAVIPLHTSYVDLGAVLIDPYGTNVGIHAYQNGKEVVTPSIDTSTTSVATIEYRATDPNGVTVMVRRIVLIGGASDPGGEIASAGAIPSQQQASTSPAPQPSNTSTQQTTSSNTTTNTTSNPSSSQNTSSSTNTSTSTSPGAATSSATTTATATESTSTTDASSTPSTNSTASSSESSTATSSASTSSASSTANTSVATSTGAVSSQ